MPWTHETLGDSNLIRHLPMVPTGKPRDLHDLISYTDLDSNIEIDDILENALFSFERHTRSRILEKCEKPI